MNSKEYKLPNGKKAVFEYDITGVGKITLECMDELMGMIADRPSGEWMPKNSHTMYCSVCGFEEVEWRTQDYGYCPNCGCRMKDVTEGLESRTDLIWYGDKTDLIGDETGRHTGWFGKGADDE